MTSKDFFDRYGVALGVLALMTLVLVLLPSNVDDQAVGTSGGSGQFGSSSGGGVASGDNGSGAPAFDDGATTGSADAGGGFSNPSGSTGGATSSGGSGGGSVATGGGSTGGSTSGGGSTGGGGTPGTTPPAGGGGGGQTQQAAVVFGQGPNCDANGRQIGISGYMAPCVQWNGTDNGGATHRGVTRDTIKIAIWQGQEDPATRSALSGARLNDEPPVVARMYEALRRYANNHYETYGREVVFVEVTASGDSESDEAMKADAIKIADEIGAFAAFTGNALAPMPTVLGRGFAQRGVVCNCTTSLSSEFYNELPPLLWGSLPTINEYAVNIAEYAAKKLGFEPAANAGPQLQNSPRVYCLMYITGTGETVDPEGARGAGIFRDEFKRVGISFKTEVAYLYDPGSNQNDVTAMITKFKNEGCTTLLPIVDPIMPILITREATNQAYFPEWLVFGTGLSDTTTIARFYDQAQWEHAFGISPLWVTWDRVENSAGYHEFHHGMPGRQKGDEGALINVYRAPFQTLWIGIHMAGPNLNPQTFEQGMYNYPATGGGPANPLVKRSRQFPTEIKDFSEIWYDPSRVGPDERSENGTGMIVRADGGKRYKQGEWPSGPPSRNNPVTVTPAQGNNIDHYADGHTHEKRCLSCSN